MAALPIEDCLTSTSSTISPTEASFLGKDVQEKNTITQSKNGLYLDLNLSFKQSESAGSSSKTQPNFEVKDQDSSNPAGFVRLAASLAGAKKEENHHVFKCRYCWRTFDTSQALCGHQSIHVRERQAGRRGQPIDTLDSYFSSYLNLARYRPLYYSPYTPVVRFQRPSIANRPYSTGSALAGLRYGNGGHIRVARERAALLGMFNPQEGRVRNTGIQMPIASRSDGLGAASQVGNPGIQMPIASRSNGLGTTVLSGGGPPSTLMRNGVGGGRISEHASFGGHQMEPEPIEELDLTLKL